MSVGAVYAGMLWYNSEIFAKYNLKPPTTLAEWDQLCKTLKADNVGCFVQGAAQEGFDQDTLQSITNSVQPGLWTKASLGDAKWNDPGIVKALTIWKQLFDDGIMQSGAVGYQQYPDANNDFLSGKYAMVMMGTWYTQYATTKAMTAAISAAGVSGAKPFPILPMSFPDVAGAGNKSEMYGDADFGLAISSKSPNKAAAEAFVKWMATSDGGPAGHRRPTGRPARAEGRDTEFRADSVGRSGAAAAADQEPDLAGRDGDRAARVAAERRCPERDPGRSLVRCHRERVPAGRRQHPAAGRRGGRRDVPLMVGRRVCLRHD